MSRTTDRLIADRGHGLSRAQKEALRWLATEGRDGVPPRRVATWQALERVGLVEHRPEVLAFFGYRLTLDGRCLADRMFRLPRGAGQELTDEDRAEIEQEIQLDRRCGDL